MARVLNVSSYFRYIFARIYKNFRGEPLLIDYPCGIELQIPDRNCFRVRARCYEIYSNAKQMPAGI